MEVMTCQSERSLEMFMISQIDSIGGTSKHIRHEQECGRNSPSFWGKFCKTLLTQNRIFLTFQTSGILDLPHVSICQCNKYGSE